MSQLHPHSADDHAPGLGAAYDWSGYFDAVEGQPPRDTLLRALDLFDREHGPDADPRLAVDLGCGTGRDTFELLRRGWRVLAIDSSPLAIDRLRAHAADLPPAAVARLGTLVARYEDAHWPPCSLVNASFAIPHTRPEDFPSLWDKIVRSLSAGGRFAGQLFGIHDEWARRPDGLTRTYHDRAHIERLLRGVFHAEHLDEVQRPGKDALGNPKEWHVFHLVLRKEPNP